MFWLLTPLSLAAGQSTHVWMGQDALRWVEEPELQALLSAAEHQPMLVHGCMFPDGGYPTGHPYAEEAHWEPFQRDYMAWIQQHYSPPWSAEAQQHIAFWLGLGCHGLGDQVFDAHYQDRSQGYDADLGWASGLSMDEATDVGWVTAAGSPEIPERWLPTQTLTELYASRGIDADADTLESGQDLLELAVELVAWLASGEDTLAYYDAAFPWAMSHLEDASVPGRPEDTAAVIGAYWEELWARLHERPSPREILGSWPRDGYLRARSPDDPDARISLVFARPREDASAAASYFQVTDSQGRAWETPDPWVFYGSEAHVLHLRPAEDWPEDEVLTLTVSAGLPDTLGGSLLESYSFTFTTREPPPPDSPALPSDSGASAERPCGCGTGTLALPWWLALLGLGLLRRRAQAEELRRSSQSR